MNGVEQKLPNSARKRDKILKKKKGYFFACFQVILDTKVLQRTRVELIKKIGYSLVFNLQAASIM